MFGLGLRLYEVYILPGTSYSTSPVSPMKLTTFILNKGGLIVPNASDRPRFPLPKATKKRLSRPSTAHAHHLVEHHENSPKESRKKRFKSQLESQSKLEKDIRQSGIPKVEGSRRETVKETKASVRRCGYFSTALYGTERTMRQRYYKYHADMDEEYETRTSSERTRRRPPSLGKWGRFWLRYAKRRPRKKFRIRWQRLPKWLLRLTRPRWRRLACPSGRSSTLYPMWPTTRTPYPLTANGSKKPNTLIRLSYWGNSDLTKLVGEELRVAKKAGSLREGHILKSLE